MPWYDTQWFEHSTQMDDSFDAERFDTEIGAECFARLQTTRTATLHEVWRVERVFPEE